MHGLLVLDKPPGITSREAVNRATKWFPRKAKIGHAGTLDPLATGVLVLAIGQATRLVEYVQAMPKCYRTQIVLGARSDTDDADGKIEATANFQPVDEERVRAALDTWIGEVEQIPPAYSAAQVDGQRAHAIARKGGEVALSPRRVRIDEIKVLDYSWPRLELEVTCGKGTYIRSIARDLGNSLGVGGYVAQLRRLRIGAFTVEQAIPLDADPVTARANLQPCSAAVSGFRIITIDARQAEKVRHGGFVPVIESEGPIAAIGEDSQLIAVGAVVRGEFRPDKVLPIVDC